MLLYRNQNAGRCEGKLDNFENAIFSTAQNSFLTFLFQRRVAEKESLFVLKRICM